MSSLSDDSLLQEFVAESREHLSSIEPDLLILEREGANTDQEIINRVFRAIHSIKGASGFFGLIALKNLSHTMESVLMLIRDGQLVPTAKVMDPLLEGVDKLNQMLEDIHSSETVTYQDEIRRLEVILGKPPKADDLEATDISSNPQGLSALDKTTIVNATQQGQRLYYLNVSVDKDLTAKQRTPLDLLEQLISVGLLIDSSFDIAMFPDLSNCLNASLSLSILCATVLEKDLLAMAVDLPETQVQEVTMEEVLDNKKPTWAMPETEKQELSKPIVQERESAHQETKTTPVNHSAEAVETIRVRVDLLNKLMDLAGEMVLSRNQLLRAFAQKENPHNGLETISQKINLVTSELQEHIMQTRMQPVGSIFGKFPRVVRDITKQLGKEIELRTSGEDVELDKSILESLSDPLTHLIRNCCDHAIESPEERKEVGKPSSGTIFLNAFHEGGQINISISDDGRGIDHARIAKKVLENGLLSESDLKKMSPQEVVNLIFLPGLSTAEKISDISGRGVGMDVVKTNIEKVGGHISIKTQLGKGTTILLRLPLTLAIIPSLIVGACGHRFAVPQVNLVELVCVKAREIPTRIEKVGNASVLRLRGKLLPLVRLADVLGLERVFFDSESGQYHPDRRIEIANPRFQENTLVSDSETLNQRTHYSSDYNIMVLKVGANQYGLIVDELFDMEEIVVKPLSSFIQHCKCYAGATIMGDGQVAMILDAGGILSYTKLSFSESQAEENYKKQLNTLDQTTIEQQAMLLFKNAPDETFGLPLSSVLRIEKFNRNEIEQLGGREFLTYQNRSIELLRLERYLPVKSSLNEQKEWFLILPKSANGRMGIIASQIVDSIDMQLDLDTTVVTNPGVIGSSVVQGHLTVFINPQTLLEKHYESRGLVHAS
ncbi:MAG: chemotaxis protein CheA [Candidatus Melainabacteria bacterium]|nr:chemotaxis protein CheA [Candidatus Melainabacteria bacterium]